MMIIPVKLLPYLMVIAGLFGFTESGDTLLEIGILAAGLVWLYIKHSAKQRAAQPAMGEPAA